MKYMMCWTFRMGGTARDNEEAAKRGLALLAKWSPPETATIQQFVQRVDNMGGFSVVETDNPADLAESTAKFATIADYTIYPVLDMEEGARLLQQGIEFRESVAS